MTIYYRAEGMLKFYDFTTTLAEESDYKQEVIFHEFPVTKLTPKGCRINIWGESKFILKSSRKKYAWPTKEEALISYIRRKELYVNRLTISLKIAKEQLKAGLLLKEKEKE